MNAPNKRLQIDVSRAIHLQLNIMCFKRVINTSALRPVLVETCQSRLYIWLYIRLWSQSSLCASITYFFRGIAIGHINWVLNLSTDWFGFAATLRS